MRITSIEYKLYKYEELSEEAKEKALQDFNSEDTYPWYDENKDVLEKFAKIFNISINGWEYGYHKYVNFSMDCEYEEIEELTGIRLVKYLWNNYKNDILKGKYYSTKRYYDENKKYHYKYRHSKIILNNDCVLTGYYLDMDILDPIYKFLEQPNNNITFKELIEECLTSWVNACDNDIKYYYSSENLQELSQDNEYEFLEDGTIFCENNISA
jgi:hypothetical protein